MLLALDGKSVVDVWFDKVEKLRPERTTLLRTPECVGVANHDQTIPSAREKNVETLRSKHETKVIGFIAASQRRNDNVTFLALVVV